MANADLLLAFFEAENKRDWPTYRKYLSPKVIWVLHSGQTKTIWGIDDYLAAMTAAYTNNRNTFICEALYQSGDGTRIAAILKSNSGIRSCDVFEFFDGFIIKEYEFISD